MLPMALLWHCMKKQRILEVVSSGNFTEKVRVGHLGNKTGIGWYLY